LQGRKSNDDMSSLSQIELTSLDLHEAIKTAVLQKKHLEGQTLKEMKSSTSETEST
jgi:hypothetical protein